MCRRLLWLALVAPLVGPACDEEDGGETGASSSASVGGASSGSGGVGGGGQGGAAPCSDGPGVRLLFIGNSHTYVNDVPALVRELACSGGARVESTAVAAPGASLVDHASNPAVFDAIASQPWDFVLIQDQQQRPGFRLPEVEVESVAAAEALVDAVRANDPSTVPLFYMVWARQDGDAQNCAYYPLLCTYEGATLAVSQGYELYAERTATDLVPVALAWAQVQTDVAAPLPGGELWSDDGSHASVAGSYLAASMIAARALATPAAALTYEAGLPKPVADYLRAKGDEVLASYSAEGRADTAEHVLVACDEASGCDLSHDTAGVVFSLSSGSCAEIADGSAPLAGRIETTLDCAGLACLTVPLGRWSGVEAGTISPGGYSVQAHVDVDRDGVVDAGEPVGCESGAFVVGGGVDLTLSTFVPG
ncbi:MAG: SGNH/GDSL hydrolase family protein [Myxococcales bacterium]|nr:SGNH/GDSL hydrolase family protein [Myxococcales bacterium]